MFYGAYLQSGFNSLCVISMRAYYAMYMTCTLSCRLFEQFDGGFDDGDGNTTDDLSVTELCISWRE